MVVVDIHGASRFRMVSAAQSLAGIRSLVSEKTQSLLLSIVCRTDLQSSFSRLLVVMRNVLSSCSLILCEMLPLVGLSQTFLDLIGIFGTRNMPVNAPRPSGACQFMALSKRYFPGLSALVRNDRTILACCRYSYRVFAGGVGATLLRESTLEL